jgi:hypothetical protein
MAQRPLLKGANEQKQVIRYLAVPIALMRAASGIWVSCAGEPHMHRSTGERAATTPKHQTQDTTQIYALPELLKT